MTEKCKVHPDVDLVTITYCPACRGQAGGVSAAKRRSKAKRKSIARKAALARWNNPKRGDKE